MSLYRKEDVDAITEAMPKIKEEIRKITLRKFEPTINEINNVNSIIHKFIRDKKRIIYGGFAQNKLIEVKNKDDVFYKELDTPDVEFYTPTPIEDLMELCDILYNKGIKRINGQEGIHNETYKIFVNFEDYCDISYMPKNVYDNIPTLDIDGFKLADPLFMTIDVFRVFSDPLTSYWRVEKSFHRNSLILKHYPLPQNEENVKITNVVKEFKTVNFILRFIRKHILRKFDTLIVFGYYAYNYFIKKSRLKDLLTQDPYYDIISTNFENDIVEIYNLLKKKYGKNIYVREFYKFSQFAGRSVKFYYKKHTPILNVYDHNNRCTVYLQSKKKKMKIASFQTMIMMILVGIAYNHVNKNNYEKKNQTLMLSNIIEARNKYLKKRKLTVVDKTPFMEFGYQCLGKTIEQTRLQRLEIEERKKANKRYVFRYEPTGKQSKKPNYSFDDSSGNEIKKRKHKIIKLN